MFQYRHPEIVVNGRDVRVEDIISGNAHPLTVPEENAFLFIRDWLKGHEKFEINTSGSTGRPKRISITRDQMTASARLTAQALNLEGTMQALLCLDAKYIAGRMMIVRSLVTGMRLYIADPSADPLSMVLPDNPIDFVALVPYQVMAILESKHPHLIGRVRKMLIGGAPLEDHVIQRLTSFSSEIYLTYGMTETISHIALRRINGPDAQEYFQTLPDVEISTDARGCLIVTAPYLNEAIITNDLVEIFNNHQFAWRGRYDHVINSGGVKISPENLEGRIGKIFTRLNLRNRFFIHALPDARLGQRAVLVMDGSPPDASTLDELTESILHSFPPHERPKELYLISSFVLTDTHKINRQETLANASLLRTLLS